MSARITLKEGRATPSTCSISPTRSITFGRRSDNDVVIPDAYASRWHARIYCDKGDWMLVNTSVNGTLVSDQLVTDKPFKLSDGDRISFHSTVFVFSTGSPVPNQPADSSDSMPTRQVSPDITAPPGAFDFQGLATTRPIDLIRTALRELITRTQADWGGFLSLDLENPLPRLLIPDESGSDPLLSRRMTRLARDRQRRVWLHEEFRGANPGDSLATSSDSLCLPLRTVAGNLGNLHLYRREGAFTVEQVNFAVSLAESLSPRLRQLCEWQNLGAEVQRLRERLGAAEGLIGDCEAIKELRARIRQVARLQCPVLIEGEVGTEKGAVAEQIHRSSERSGPLVVFHASAFSPTELMQRLFGAPDQTGMFHRTDGGTLVLTEVSDFPLEVQGRLLALCDGYCIYRGGPMEEGVFFPDVRLIVTTSRDLHADAREGRFLPELLFRLYRLPVTVPPLRSRLEDIPQLADAILKAFAQEHAQPAGHLTEAALERLNKFEWPGNVRQLEAVVRLARLTAPNPSIGQNHLRFDLWQSAAPEEPP